MPKMSHFDLWKPPSVELFKILETNLFSSPSPPRAGFCFLGENGSAKRQKSIFGEFWRRLD